MIQEDRRLGVMALCVGALGIAASSVLNKLALAAGLHPIWVNVFRMGLSVLVMLPFFLRKRGAVRALFHAPRREALLMLLSGVMLAIHFATWTTALKHADSVVAVTIWSTFSLMTVVGSSVLLHEKTPLPALLGLLLAVAGVGVCAVGASGSQLLGVFMALCAAVTQAVYTLCGRMVRRRIDTMPYTMAVYSLALLCLLLFATVLRLPMDGITSAGVGWAFALAVFCTLGGHSMQSFALKFFKAPTVSAAILTEVFTGPLLVLIFLGERPKLVSLIGGAVILIGVAWYMGYEWRGANGTVHGNRGKAQRTDV